MIGPNAAVCDSFVFFFDLTLFQWSQIISDANANPDILNLPQTIKQLANIMKTNVAACTAIGTPFIIQIGRIYNDMLTLYRVSSEMISKAVQEGGMVLTYPSILY